MKAERIARVLIVLLAVGLPSLAVIARSSAGAIELHGSIADNGGWSPANLSASVGQPIHLRLTSDDVVHGFAIGQSDQAAIDVMPGVMTETMLIFDQPGKYTFYCTRWCGINHWRMRGTIEVSGSSSETVASSTPLYIDLKLNIDDPHPADVVPADKPSAERGLAVQSSIPLVYLDPKIYQTQSPAVVWRELRIAPFSKNLSDAQVWDLVAIIWKANTTPHAFAEGQKLFAQNCAACHGEVGQGNGVMAAALDKGSQASLGESTLKPIDFTNAANMLGASSAVLQGKIIRGGMGTGMPYWAPIFTDRQISSLINYLWSFQFDTLN
jgi:mono/diheme cytochrome c family protein/plastocyanin